MVCYGLKKIHTRNLITKKNSCGSKIPLPPPPNFSNGPSLTFSLNSTPRQYGQFLRPPQWRGFTVQAAED